MTIYSNVSQRHVHEDKYIYPVEIHCSNSMKPGTCVWQILFICKNQLGNMVKLCSFISSALFTQT